MKTDSWTVEGRKELKDRPKWFKGTPASKPDGVLTYNRSGMTLEVLVKNGEMGYEDFYADFSDETKGKFNVTPKTGVLERRGGKPQNFEIEYLGGGSGETGHLIVMTESEKFCFKIVVP